MAHDQQDDSILLFDTTELNPVVEEQPGPPQPNREEGGVDQQVADQEPSTEESTEHKTNDPKTTATHDELVNKTTSRTVSRQKTKKERGVKNNNTQTCTAGACPGRKLSAPFLRCCVCMTWLHPQCVGDSKEDADVCGTWTCHKCRFVPSQISQLVKTTQQMSKDIQSIRQLQTSYSKLHNSLDAAYKNNQHLKLPTVNNFERRLLNLSHESSDIRLPVSPASPTTSSSSSFTSPSSTP